MAWLSALELKKSGHEVYIITATEKAAFSDVRQGIVIHFLHCRYPLRLQSWLSLWNPQTVGPLRDLLHRIAPDVVHAHNVHNYLSYASLGAAHRLGIPVILTAHDTMAVVYTKLTHFIDPKLRGPVAPIAAERYRLPRFYNLRQMHLRYNPLRNLLIRRLLRRQVQIRLCVSDAQRQALEANNLPPFQVVYNGIDPTPYDDPQIAALADQLRRRWELAGKKVVLFAGRLTLEKGSRPLFAAMRRVVAELPDARLLLLTHHIEEWLQSPDHDDLAACVQVGGWLEGAELLAAFRAADVICAPSIFLDCAPLVILEGMAAGKPVVASQYGGAPELIADGETGCIVNPYDTAQLADTLVAMLRDPERAAAMGTAGRKRLEAHFLLTHQTAQFTALYTKVSRRGAKS